MARRLIARKASGRIVNISSMTANHYAGEGAALYSITKAGLPLLRGLKGLAQSTHNVRLRDALHDVLQSLESGRDFATSLARHADIFPHHFDFLGGVMKISAARTNHDLEADTQPLPGNFDAASAGRGAPLEEIIAEFHAVGAALLGRYRPVH